MHWLGPVMLLTACSFRVPAATGPGDDAGPNEVDGGGDIDADVRPVARCGTPGVITESFGSMPVPWIATSGAMVTGGQLVVPPMATLTSRAFVDLVDADAEVEVPAVGDTGATFRLMFDAGRYVGIEARAGQVTAVATGTGFSLMPYTAADRYWRISERSGTVTFATSADRAAWRQLGTLATPSYARAVRIVLGSSGTATGANPARFDNVNQGVPSASWCKAATLIDTFGAVAVAPFGVRWNTTGRIGSSCTTTISGGAAHADQAGSGAADCWFGSSADYDLRDSSVSTYITTICTYAAGWRTYLAVRDDANRSLSIAFDNNELCASGTSVTRTCRGYASDDEYWRLREAAGTVYFESSKDNATWTVVHQVAAPFDLSAVTIRTGTVADGMIGFSIGLSISDINP